MAGFMLEMPDDFLYKYVSGGSCDSLDGKREGITNSDKRIRYHNLKDKLSYRPLKCLVSDSFELWISRLLVQPYGEDTLSLTDSFSYLESKIWK